MIPQKLRLPLKWLALVTMTIDHVGFGFFPEQLAFRYIGRLAFPLFALLLVQGFFLTRSVPSYLARLGLFALVSQIPYSLFFNSWSPQDLNVFASLFLGLLLIFLSESSFFVTLILALAFFLYLPTIQFLEISVIFFLYLVFVLAGVHKVVVAPSQRPQHKYLFYAYYPVHLFALWFLRLLLAWLYYPPAFVVSLKEAEKFFHWFVPAIFSFCVATGTNY